MKLLHPGSTYDLQHDARGVDEPCYLRATFTLRCRGQTMISVAAHPYPLTQAHSATGEFTVDTVTLAALSPSTHVAHESEFVIAGTVDFVELKYDDALGRFEDEASQNHLDCNDLSLPFWERLGYSHVAEFQPERVYEATLQGRLFRISAARRLDGSELAWTSVIEELEPNGYWYRFTFANELLPKDEPAKAVAFGASIVAAHVTTTQHAALATTSV